METAQYVEMKHFYDVRQSEKWAKYLCSFGWGSHRSSRGANIMFKSYRFGSFVKIQHPPVLYQSDLLEIEDFCKKIKAIFIKIEPSLDQEEEHLNKMGYIFSSVPHLPTKTMFIDLTKSEEDLWLRLSRSAKYSVRRAQREGTVTKYFDNPSKEILMDYFKICKETGSRKHFYVPAYKDLEAKARAFGNSSHLVLVYSREGYLCGGKLFLGDKDTVLYATGGTSAEGIKNKSGYELLWKSIVYLKEKGYKVLDLEGLDDDRFPFETKSWGGFSHFKEKFNGEIIMFPRPRIKYLSPLLKFMSKYSKIPF